MGASAAAVIIAKERRLIEHFRTRGATSPETALTLEQLGVAEHCTFRRLLRRDVLREPQPGRYFADIDRWEALRRTRRTAALLVLLVLLIVFVVIALLGPR